MNGKPVSKHSSAVKLFVQFWEIVSLETCNLRSIKLEILYCAQKCFPSPECLIHLEGQNLWNKNQVECTTANPLLDNGNKESRLEIPNAWALRCQLWLVLNLILDPSTKTFVRIASILFLLRSRFVLHKRLWSFQFLQFRLHPISDLWKKLSEVPQNGLHTRPQPSLVFRGWLREWCWTPPYNSTVEKFWSVFYSCLLRYPRKLRFMSITGFLTSPACPHFQYLKKIRRQIKMSENLQLKLPWHALKDFSLRYCHIGFQIALPCPLLLSMTAIFWSVRKPIAKWSLPEHAQAHTNL